MRPADGLIVSRMRVPSLCDFPLLVRERRSVNDGPDSDQHMLPLHLHLIPRRPGDLLALLWGLLVRFLPMGRKQIEVCLQYEADQLRLIIGKEN